jgi:hypothetical protein
VEARPPAAPASAGARRRRPGPSPSSNASSASPRKPGGRAQAVGLAVLGLHEQAGRRAAGELARLLAGELRAEREAEVGRDLLRELEQRAHAPGRDVDALPELGLVAAQDLVGDRELLHQVPVGLGEAARGERAAEQLAELLEVAGLGDVVVGALAQGVDRALDRDLAGDQDDRQLGLHGLEAGA